MKRTIETTGEGNLFAEHELPFNLQGELDDTAHRQEALDAIKTEQEQMRAAEQMQNLFF